MKKRLFLSAAAIVAVVVGVVGFSAFEAHIINVTAQIENALAVDTNPIDFGTVFPQEAFDENIQIDLSQSFLDEDRVDDIQYVIRQKPKCQRNEGASPDLPEFGLVTEDATGAYVCVDQENYHKLPVLCPFLSKHKEASEGTENDSEGINAFHGPATDWVLQDTVNTEVAGYLRKLDQDIEDTWTIDFRVPCFNGQCAQDWADFVAANNPTADPNAYILPNDLEHELFGCDLWIEVGGVSETPDRGNLTVIKVVENTHGGTAVVGDFDLFVDGTQVTSGESNVFEVGTYTVSESGPGGYEATFSGACDASGNVTIADGDDLTCTITNRDTETSLTVEKVVTNDNGGTAVVSDWTYMIDATTVTSGVANPLAPGSYVVSETGGPSGYTATFSGACDASGNVTLALGDNLTCTITNDDQQAELTVTKVVEGGTAVVDDFDLFVGGTQVNSGELNMFDAGTYAITESGPGGYAPTFTGDCDASGNITLVPGQVGANCTITNVHATTITVIKEVTNDNGGDAIADDFDLFVDATQVTNGVPTDVSAGTYVVSEANGPAGYAATFTGDCDASGNITIAEGESLTCTITNDDIPARITVTKVVVKDDGGVAEVADFNLYVSGTQVISGETNDFDAGSYTIGEDGLFGYNATITGDCDSAGNVTAGLDEDINCTITNDDIAPVITLVKSVINDNGGTLTASEFTLLLDGTSISSGSSRSVTANTPHTIDEVAEPGYDFVSITGAAECPAVLGGTATLTVGQSITCTITNDDQE